MNNLSFYDTDIKFMEDIPMIKLANKYVNDKVTITIKHLASLT